MNRVADVIGREAVGAGLTSSPALVTEEAALAP